MPPQADSQETKHLLQRAGEGDRQAFERLFAQHRPMLRKLVALRIDARLRQRLDPSDIVQETQMVAFRRFRDYWQRQPMPFRLWLRKTAQQQLCDARRAHVERHHRTVKREEAALSRSSRLLARGLLSTYLTPLDKLQQRERERQVALAVEALGDADREIVIMRNVEGLSFDEIAPVLEMQTPAVRQRYGRALLKLRAQLNGSDSSDG